MLSFKVIKKTVLFSIKYSKIFLILLIIAKKISLAFLSLESTRHKKISTKLFD